MYPKIKLTVLGIIFSLGLIAQGKLYVVPHIGFYSGAYKTVDSVNSKQDIIYTKPFLGKDFTIGLTLAYTHKNFEYNLGIESGFYSSAYKHTEPKSWPVRTDSRASVSQGEVWVYQGCIKYKAADFNIKLPHKIRIKHPEKPYLLVSQINPFIGAEFRRLGRTFVQDFEEPAAIYTSTYGTIPGVRWYHSYSRNHFSMRAGVDWVFYNAEKRRFIITLMYQFAFNDAGYYRYHFRKPSHGLDFYYQNTTRGNGFSIKAGVPIKIFENKKKKVK